MNKYYLRTEFDKWLNSLESGRIKESDKSYVSYLSGFFNDYAHELPNEGELEALHKEANVDNINDAFDRMYSLIYHEKNRENARCPKKTLENRQVALRQYHHFFLSSIKLSDDDGIIINKASNSLSPIEPLTLEKDEIVNKYVLRLMTQDRPYGDVYFPISVLKKLFYYNSERDFFDHWIKKQINDINVFTEKYTLKLSEIESISILQDGSVQCKTKDEIFDLYTKTASGDARFKVYIRTFSQLELDHIKPMREILEMKNEKGETLFPVLYDITTRFRKKSKSITNRKEIGSVGKSLLKEGIINKDDIPGLKKDLELIRQNIYLQLMGKGEHVKKGDK
jgi:hypothetical protein